MSALVMMVLLSIAVMIGKMMGGYLSKWFGVRNVLIASLLLSGTVFLMCPWHDRFVPATLFLINLSMPCTLFLATKALPGREGALECVVVAVEFLGYCLVIHDQSRAFRYSFLCNAFSALMEYLCQLIFYSYPA